MTVEIKYRLPEPRTASDWQVDMARQIESNRGFPIEEIDRRLDGHTLIVRVQTDLPSQAVDNMLSDIDEHLRPAAKHVETREV